MNTASRMESTGTAGAVQCTLATLHALGPVVSGAVAGCFERASVHVKGLGATETCLVRSGTPEADTLMSALSSPAAAEPDFVI